MTRGETDERPLRTMAPAGSRAVRGAGALPSGALAVSVVVPAHRDGPDLARCLDALAACDPPPDEIVVVVDGGDGAVSARARRASVHTVVVEESSGPAHARNVGAAAASGELLYFVDSDVAVHPDVIGVVREHFAAKPDVDAIIGSYDDAPPAPGALSRYKNLLNHFVHQRARVEASTFWGACGAIRREAFDAVGGFDAARYPRPCVEDIELGYRLLAAGRRIQVRKDLQVAHLKRWTPRSLLRSDILDRGIPWSALILERRGFDDDLNVSRIQRAKVLLACLTALVLPTAVRSRPGRGAAVAGVGGLTLLDAPLLAFLLRRGGLRVGVVGMAWHWLSYCYSAAAFAVALTRRGR